jgi:hypothetical protein
MIRRAGSKYWPLSRVINYVEIDADIWYDEQQVSIGLNLAERIDYVEIDADI